MKILYQCIKNSFLQDIRYPVNFIFGILTPVFTLIPILLIVELFNETENLSYYIVGIIVWMFLSQIIWGNGVILKTEKQKGTIEQIMLTPTKLTIFIYSKSIYFVVKAYLTMVGSILFSNVIFDTAISVEKISIVLIFAFPFYYGFSILVSVFCIKVDYLFAILQTILGVLMIMSGLTYEINLNTTLMRINNFNAVYQLVNLSRRALTQNLLDVIFCKEMKILLGVGIVLLLIMNIVVRAITKKYMKRGI